MNNETPNGSASPAKEIKYGSEAWLIQHELNHRQAQINHRINDMLEKLNTKGELDEA
jgi:hypothetical protein